jgi:hypothetical protein
MPRPKSTKQKPGQCSRCGDRHLPPTGKKCPRPPTLAAKTDAVDSDDSSEDVLMGQDMASGGACGWCSAS